MDLPARSGSRALQLTFVPADPVPAASSFQAWMAGDGDLRAALEELGLPAGEVGRLDAPHVPQGAEVRTLPLLPTIRVLAAMPGVSAWPAWSRPADSVLAWSVGAKLGLETVTGGRLLPMLRATNQPDAGIAVWRARAPRDGRVAALATMLPVVARAVEHADGTVWDPEELVEAFLDAVADACGRQGHRPGERRRRGGSMRPWSEVWPEALAGGDAVVAPLRVPSDMLELEVEEWASPALGRRARGTARLALRLVPPAVGDGGAADMQARLTAVDEPWRLDLLLQSTIDAEALAPAEQVWAGGPLLLAGRRVDDGQDALARGLAEAARVFPAVERALDESRPTAVELEPSEASGLLGGVIDDLGLAGVSVLVPPELRDVQARRLRARIRIGQTTATAGRVDESGILSQRGLTSFEYEMALGEDALSEEEFAEIVSLKRSLVRWRGEWVRIDLDEAEKIGALAGQTGTMDLTEAVAAALAGQAESADDDLDWIEATAQGDVADLLDRLLTADAPEDARIVAIEGDLRPYQERGVAWMQRMADLGGGGILADEMGLGKTLMAIALLTSRRQDRPHLIVAPTSVVGNWERELRRFAPLVPVIRHHGPERPNVPSEFPPAHAVLTSYALLRRDVGLLTQVDWDIVIFDEAQQIKNAASKGAKAARAINARNRFALTGTPIENRLAELWSILDVTNPGMLGTQRTFNERYAVPIERWRDTEAADRLKRLIAPFVVRRRKDDPDVQVDLPPKQEITVACSLTREQATLYQAAIDQAFASGMGSTAFERRGRILALLTALKQICNHPRQYTRDGGRLPSRSGKLDRATEILGEITANGDHALVFTQFREMGELLADHLAETLGLREVPFLHGGTPMLAREAMVDRFQDDPESPPILLVSLRAGGTGLNLTRATEVIHFDRWWNPAVEDQATDRVHRIGQTRPVTVHRLVTSGTIEERIAELLEKKRALADAVVGEGEAWITELDDDDLRELVALSSDDVEDDEDAA